MRRRIFLMFTVLLVATGCYVEYDDDNHHYGNDSYTDDDHDSYDIHGYVYACDTDSGTIFYPSGTDSCIVYLYDEYGYLVDSAIPDSADSWYEFAVIPGNVSYSLEAYYELDIDGDHFQGYSPVYDVYLDSDYTLNIDLFGTL